MKITSHLAAIAGVGLATGLALNSHAAVPGLYFNAEAGANWAADVDDVELDLGFRFGAGVGYNLNKNWGVEFDTGWVWNSVKDTDSSLTHIPLMVNGVFRHSFNDKWETYAGVGVGGAYSILTVDETISGTPVDDDDGDIVFAWQVFAGIRYNIKENMSLGLGYKFLNTAESDYDIGGGSVSLDNTQNHTFGVVFNMKF